MEPRRIRGLDSDRADVALAIRENRLALLTIFSGPGCNLHCPYCFTGEWSQKRGELTLCEYRDLFTSAAAIGGRAVWWVGQGEPFLVQFWDELIKASNASGLWIGIFTNGTLLNEESSEFLASQDVSLYIKLNSFNPGIQGQLVGSDGAAFLDQVVPRIEWFVSRGMAETRRLAVESVITKLNYDEIPALFRWCRDRDIVPFIEMMEHACDGARELDVTPQQHVELFRDLQRIDREEYGYEWDIVPPWAAYRCRNIYLGVAVDAWGNVTPCSGMRYNLGNIREKSLKEIWESDEARKIRDPARQEPQPWGGKTLGCYGCKSHAYHLTGNPYALDPRCSWFDSAPEINGTAKHVEAAP